MCKGSCLAGSTMQDTQTIEIGYAPHKWQRWFHNCTARDRALIAGIRGGKTVAGSMEFLRMVTGGKPGVSMISGPDIKTLKQATIHTMLHGMGPNQLGKWPRELIADYHQTDQKITLVDGNMILIRGADDPDDLRGPAAKCYWVDEVTLCKPDTLTILQGRTLDTKGRGIVTGTPKGKNWFWQAIMPQMQEVEPGRVWRGPRWELIRYPTADNPAITSEDIASLAEGYPEALRRQELEADFVDWGGVVFRSEDIDKCIKMPVAHWRRPGGEGHKVQIGFDPAGKGKDYSVFIVICRKCRAVIDIWRERRVAFERLYREAERLCSVYKPFLFQYDATGLGDPIGEELAHRVRGVKAAAMEPFVFTAKSKVELLMELVSHLETGLAIPVNLDTRALIQELRGYEWDDKELVKDCVMALALAARTLPLGDKDRRSMPQFANLAEEPYRAVDWPRETLH